MATIRVRFAPSPTGHLHVGGARTALFNWLFARQNNGVLVLRIEDTDLARSTKESEEVMLNDLKWLGLHWDEGPDKGGDFGPYRQSERLSIYREYADKLLAEGKAYHCFCTDEELEAHREQRRAEHQTPHYSGKCRQLSDAEKEKLKRAGRTPAIRFKASAEDINIKDLVRGNVTFPQGMIGDFIIMRSQGYPIYNFCVTIDDALMKISHVIRGEEHLSNTLRQIMLYKALGFPLPTFAHLSLILAGDRSKLSKRHGHSSLGQFEDKGYLPEAMINYLALLGWAPTTLSGDVEEMLSVEEITRQFSLEKVNKSPAVFDLDKLNFLSGHYIRRLPPEKTLELARPYLEQAGLVDENTDQAWLTEVVMELRGHLHCFSEITQHTDVFFKNELKPESDAEWEMLKAPGVTDLLSGLKGKLSGLTAISPEEFFALIKELKKEFGVKGKALFMPVRIALSGQQHGPDLGKLVSLVGPANCVKRIESALQNL